MPLSLSDGPISVQQIFLSLTLFISLSFFTEMLISFPYVESSRLVYLKSSWKNMDKEHSRKIWLQSLILNTSSH